MLIARFKMFPEVKEKGMAAIPRLVAFTSEHVCFFILYNFLYLLLLIKPQQKEYLNKKFVAICLHSFNTLIVSCNIKARVIC